MKSMVALFFGILLIGATSASANFIRTGSSYGQIASSQVETGIGTEYLVPLTPISSSDIDMLLQIDPASPNLNTQIQLTISLTASFQSGTTNFGVLNCDSNGTAGSNLGTVCTPTTNPLCDLTNVTPVGGTITIPGACIAGNETFYFDEASSTGSFAPVAPVSSVTAPEPSSVALLGIGLISLAFIRRRQSDLRRGAA